MEVLKLVSVIGTFACLLGTMYHLISNKGWVKWAAATGGFAVLLAVSYLGTLDSTQAALRSETPERYKASCQAISYAQLARNTEQHTGSRFVLTGQVIQVMEKGNRVVMRVNVTRDEHGWWKDTILVDYVMKKDDTRILEDDIIQLWGPVKGRTTYEGIFGQEITLPHVAAAYIEFK